MIINRLSRVRHYVRDRQTQATYYVDAEIVPEKDAVAFWLGHTDYETKTFMFEVPTFNIEDTDTVLSYINNIADYIDQYRKTVDG